MDMLKLNLACGSDIKKDFININDWNRDNNIDLICDLTKEFPFNNESVDYIYCSHFLEHLNWFDGRELLVNCFRVLKRDGILRIVIPDFKKSFKKYIDGDREFFKPYFKNLNDSDWEYYSTVYHEPEKIRKRKNKPPEWHFTNREKVRERIRHYDYLIDIINYIVFQYGEHKNLFDYLSLKALLERVGFREIRKSKYKEGFDSSAKTRINFSLYVEAIK